MKPNAAALGIVLKSRGGVESEPVPKSVLRQVVGNSAYGIHLNFLVLYILSLYCWFFWWFCYYFIAG